MKVMCKRWVCGLLGLVSVLVLAACGEEPPAIAGDDASGVTAVRSQTEQVGGVIPAYQLEALNKAKSVEGMLEEQEAKRRAQLEAAGG